MIGTIRLNYHTQIILVNIIYKVCSKGVISQAVFTETENDELNAKFLQNITLGIKHKFPWVFHWSKLLWNSSFDTM